VSRHPELTIAIATRDRPQLLTDVLRSCAQQHLEDAFFEILVVPDGDTEGTKAACESFADELAQSRQRLSFRIVEPWSEPHGLAAARNVCADEARGRFVRFQDDDDILEPYAAEAMLSAHFEMGLRTAVLGYTGIANHLFGEPIMRYLFEDGGELFNYRHVPTGPLGFDWFWGGRTSVATDVARSVRFDENLRFGAEDIEFAYRARLQMGLNVRYVPVVRSFMIRCVDLESFALRCHRQGQAARYVATKHPGTALEKWAEESHAYLSSGDGQRAFSLAYDRCRKLELSVQYHVQSGENSQERTRILSQAYFETFGLARSLGFAGSEISIGD
jgi:glycosyltransferase involved in cell wall biosynthesis